VRNAATPSWPACALAVGPESVCRSRAPWLRRQMMPPDDAGGRAISMPGRPVSRRSEAIRAVYGVGRTSGSQLGADQGEQVAHQHLDPALGQHGEHLGLAVRTRPDELGPVPHQLG
jgi:hypothetical protein